MRKFLVEYRDIITEEELRDFYENESEDKAYMTFDEMLADGLGKNGSLTEIQTEDTPRGQYAVTLYKVHYSDDPDDVCEEWLSQEQARDKVWYHDVILELV